ncbi:RNA polymerase sigma-70 factor, ECF subfamily [Sphingomonas jatrophae]|uniref:RNA polymerase sigma-70 factor, ECF subfamily n=1 Tax=Sphingomonas jatrophae TaxID=1166337 RepID=A0A1I6M097_9SPHN|nr:RNA polymerase sigma-70 factor, ECF subfamily [Sphingomonas jatrophae]
MEGALHAYDSIVRFVRARFRRTDEAQDVVQDAFLRLTIASRRDDIRDPVAFLRTTAANLIRDRVRADGVRAIITEDDQTGHIACPNPSAERHIIGHQAVAIVEAALAELPMKRRAAVVLSRIDGVDHRTIAAQLGISMSMVEKHVRLGLDHIRRHLAEAEERP